MTIQDLIPMLKPGWIAMNENGSWMWFKDRPMLLHDCWMTATGRINNLSTAFDIEKAPNKWNYTLQKIQ